MSAEIHAEIASKVYPDVYTKICKDGCQIEHDWLGEGYMQWRYFNLLETDSNGNPTQQAKASSFDCCAELDVSIFKMSDGTCRGEHCTKGGSVLVTKCYENPCAAIYEAAKAIIND